MSFRHQLLIVPFPIKARKRTTSSYQIYPNRRAIPGSNQRQLKTELNKQTHIRLAGKFEERCRAAKFHTVDEVFALEVEQVDRHLAGDQAHTGFQAEVAQFGDGGDAFVLDLLLHHHGGHAFHARQHLHEVGHGDGHRHGGVAERGDLEFAEILLEQGEAVEGEKDADFVIQRRCGGGEDEGRVGPVERTLAGNEGEFFHYARLRMKKVYSPSPSAKDNSSLPVCLQNA